jgi:hypothetical protein
MTKLTVVYLQSTMHVLAALTRTDPPQADEPVSALIGTGLPVRFIGQLPVDLILHAQDLSAVTVDNQPDVLINPQNFQVAQDQQSQALQVIAAGVPGSTVNCTIDHTSGAAITVTGVLSAPSLQAVVVLQKLTPPRPAPTILPPVTLTMGVSTPVHDKSGFLAGDTWNVYALVKTLLPTAQSVHVT